MEGYFFNDLVAFDLNALQQATNRWEILLNNSIDGGPPQGTVPPARTNHTMVTWGDKLYLFGGTDGVHWFNDVWSYSPVNNAWTQLECIGYIPSPREGHAAALVGDVMYIFGGRTEEGNDLGDLAAFRITSRRWYTFQNMGPSPSPRSGHSMTTVGKQIVVLAGEPSSAPRDVVELAYAYFLDTGKIRYPADSASQTPVNERIQGHRRPSGEKSGLPVGAGRGQPPPQSRDLVEPQRIGSGDLKMRSDSSASSRLPQASRAPAQLPAPSAPPPQAPPQQPRTNGIPASRQPTRADGTFSPAANHERVESFDRTSMTSPQTQVARSMTPTAQNASMPTSPSFAPPQETSYYDPEAQEQPRKYKPETYQPSQDQRQSGDTLSRSASRSQPRNQSSRAEAEPFDETPRQSQLSEVPEQMLKVRELLREDERPQDSGIGSSPALTQQYDGIAKELEEAKSRNAWYASELALARKSGYQTRSTESPVMDERAPDVFGDDDKPLIEALLKMRAELSRVQETMDEQSKSVAERIAETEKQRDAAVQEAVYAKTRLAGQANPLPDVEGKRSPDQDRSNDMGRRLASSLNAQSEQSKRMDALIQEMEAEKRARQLAEDTAEAAQKRATELDNYRQQHSSEMESLRADLHDTQSQARDITANHAEIRSQHDMLAVDKNELQGKLESALAETQNHTSILASLQEAVTASTNRADTLERKLGEEREHRDDLEQKHRQLKSDHEERTSELDHTSKRLRDAEEMAEKHEEEARTHRSAVMAGLGKVTNRDVDANQAADERVTILQRQVEAANVMVRQNQAAADSAAEKLRRAEERIAGLEAFQEQASREGLSIRKQLQAAMKENQGLSLQKADLEQKVQSQQLETNALSVQHASLRDILGERGINASEVRRSRAMDSPNSLSRFSTPDLHRVKELEQQLEASLKSHDEMKTQFEEVSERDEKMKREYEEKLTALDNDHQAAVKYLRGTEKMLSKMKQELQRVKNENGDLKRKLEKANQEGESKRDVPDDWEAERERLKNEVADVQANLHNSVSELEGRIETMQQQLQTTDNELRETGMRHATTQADLTTLQATHTQSRGDIEQLQKDNTLLEERARNAESKVQLLLDQVESSVDNYRRQSRLGEGVPTMNGTFHARHLSNLSESTTNHVPGHSRNVSDGGASTVSDSAGNDGRNSLALDSLASELDALRTHWETTNKNYRLSDKFDFERTPTSANNNTASSDFSSLANWRSRLNIGDGDDDDDKSRPTTSDGTDTVRGDEDDGRRESQEGFAVMTPTAASATSERI